MRELRIEEMTIEQKLGMVMLFRRSQEEEDIQFNLEMIKKRAVGGIQVYYQPGCEKTIAMYKEAADYPLLICLDMENGFVGSKNKIGSVMSLASTGDPSLAYKFALYSGIEAKRAGYNVVWSPVVDTGIQPRQLADNPETVSKFATEMVRGYQDAGMVCTEKHFPGKAQGGKRDVYKHVDGHIARKAPSAATLDELMDWGLKPYMDAIIKADLSGVMLGHSEFINIDGDTPTSMSKVLVDHLRNVMGFKGIIMTDSMAMMGIAKRYTFDESVWMPIAAGADIVLPNYRHTNRECFEALLKAYNEGKISDERLDDAVRHVIEAQKRTIPEPADEDIDAEFQDLCAEITRKSIVPIMESGEEVKLSENTKKLFVITHENLYRAADDVTGELPQEGRYTKAAALRKKELIERAFPDAEVVLFEEWPHRQKTQALCRKIAEADETIFYTFCGATCYLASNCLTPRIEYLVNAYADKISTVIHSGNPREIRKYNGVKKVIYALSGEVTDKYVVAALKGDFVPTGKLPIEI